MGTIHQTAEWVSARFSIDAAVDRFVAARLSPATDDSQQVQRKNRIWEGRAMVRGKMSKSRDSIVLTANVLKRAMGLPLTSKEQELEQWTDR